MIVKYQIKTIYWKIDLLNIGLIGAALAVAVTIPFTLFIVAYAVVGPLHYLTEISWLKDRRYFVQWGNPFWLLLSSSLLLTLLIIFLQLSVQPAWKQWLLEYAGTPEGQWVRLLPKVLPGFVFFAFAASLCFVLRIPERHRAAILLFLAGFSLFVNKIPLVVVLFGVFVPTVIHVYVFTGLFMLQGAMRSGSVLGLASTAALLLTAIFIAYTSFIEPIPEIPAGIKSRFDASNFYSVLNAFAKFLGMEEERLLLSSELAARIQVFIAFAYTYHYMNWFSKTSIIKWHQVSVRRLGANGLVWLAAVILYGYDYKIGFLALLFLSYLHIFLEFPLNLRSVGWIGSELKGIFKPA